MTAKELYRLLNEAYPPSLSCSWDNDGAMCLSDPEREIKRVLVTLDITAGTADYAAEGNFDAIVSHHPLIFSPMRSINGCDIKSRVISRLMRSGISALSFHTRLDAVEGGVNDCLCEKIGIEEVRPFGKDGEMLGRIGRIGPMSGSALAALVKERLGVDSLSLTCPDKLIERVVVVGGAGKDFLDPAIDSFADALITGEIPYNAAIDAADSGLCLIMAGHFFTENPVLEELEKRIRSLDPAIEIECYYSNLIIQQ